MNRTKIFALSMLCTAATAATDHIPIDREITKISVYDTDVVIQFSPPFTNTQTCPDGGTNTGVIDMENEKGKGLLSIALAAATAKKKVGFGMGGCKNSPLIYRIDVQY